MTERESLVELCKLTILHHDSKLLPYLEQQSIYDLHQLAMDCSAAGSVAKQLPKEILALLGPGASVSMTLAMLTSVAATTMLSRIILKKIEAGESLEKPAESNKRWDFPGPSRN